MFTVNKFDILIEIFVFTNNATPYFFRKIKKITSSSDNEIKRLNTLIKNNHAYKWPLLGY